MNIDPGVGGHGHCGDGLSRPERVMAELVVQPRALIIALFRGFCTAAASSSALANLFPLHLLCGLKRTREKDDKQCAHTLPDNFSLAI